MISPSLPLSHFTFGGPSIKRKQFLSGWAFLGFTRDFFWILVSLVTFFGYCHIRKNLYSFRHLGSFNCAAKSFWNVLLATPKNWESRTSLHICAVMDLKPNPHQKLWTYGSQDLCQPSTTGRPYHCKAVRIVFSYTSQGWNSSPAAAKARDCEEMNHQVWCHWEYMSEETITRLHCQRFFCWRLILNKVGGCLCGAW